MIDLANSTILIGDTAEDTALDVIRLVPIPLLATGGGNTRFTRIRWSCHRPKFGLS